MNFGSFAWVNQKGNAVLTTSPAAALYAEFDIQVCNFIFECAASVLMLLKASKAGKAAVGATYLSVMFLVTQDVQGDKYVCFLLNLTSDL